MLNKMESSSSNESAAPKFGEIENENLFFNYSNNLNNSELIIEKMKDLNINKNNKKVVLKPRDYQQKIFDRAKNQNSIIYVETGKGKTFIAIMLMANYLGIDISIYSLNKQKIDKNKKIIFFVCDTALIEQQKKAISSILGIEVGTIQG